MRILCVDDDEDTRYLLESLLSFSDFEAIAVQDTATALLLIRQEQFKLYIIDSQLPGMSGLGLCEQIRAIDKGTPIVIFSGKAHQSDISAGMIAGANAYIVKPNTREIVPTVKRLLRATHAANA
ncbi:MAG TPA: response regulator [Pyrinomonadaceae bacterium]|nr:response regulator [Pyrinomonadaceae bacterium]